MVVGNAVEGRDLIESLLMVFVHLLLDFVKRQRDGDIGIGRRGCYRNAWIVRVERVNFTSDRFTKEFADLYYLVVKRRWLVMLIHRVDSCDENRHIGELLWLDQPKRNRASANKIPVRVGQERPRYRRMVVRVLEDNVCVATDSMTYDALK